jgi:hypothetical protein
MRLTNSERGFWKALDLARPTSRAKMSSPGFSSSGHPKTSRHTVIRGGPAANTMMRGALRRLLGLVRWSSGVVWGMRLRCAVRGEQGTKPLPIYPRDQCPNTPQAGKQSRLEDLPGIAPYFVRKGPCHWPDTPIEGTRLTHSPVVQRSEKRLSHSIARVKYFEALKTNPLVPWSPVLCSLKPEAMRCHCVTGAALSGEYRLGPTADSGQG